VKQAAHAAIVIWALLLASALALPWLVDADNAGDDLIRYTIRLSLSFYAAALALMLFLRPIEWTGVDRGGLTRWCWSLAWAAYLVHLAMAFHFYHGWSHADAIRHTEEVSGFGPGIYISHFFTLVWTLDVLLWWLWPTVYASRPIWIGRTLHAFMVFIAFNGTVIYETGPIRAAGIIVSIALAILWFFSRQKLYSAITSKADS
jgi:hypothetical protein